MIITYIFNINSTVKLDYNRDRDSGEYSFCSEVVPSQSGSKYCDATQMIRTDLMKNVKLNVIRNHSVLNILITFNL